jgi:glycosyltransferase involved in cell wall biosynthesis
MHVLQGVAKVGAWLIAAAWLGKLVEAWHGLAQVANLNEAEFDVEPAGEPWVTAIVPARNEAANVGACVKSLLGQDYRRVRIVAVDDRSTDGTGEVLAGLAGVADRLEVLTVGELPEGWLGKTHAMALAAKHTMERHAPEYLLFTDADILFRKDAIRRALARARATDADHFVLLPTTIVKTWGEGMMLSYLQVMSLFAIRPWKVADAKAKRDALGVGAFNLLRTEAYVQLGGFEAARMEILEDLDLGKRVKRAGLRQRVATGPGMVSVHWAAGAMGIVNGMTKNLFAVFGFRPWLLLAGAAGMATFYIGPAAMLGIAGLRWAGAAAMVGAAGLYGLSSRTSRISPANVLLLPVAAGAMVYSMLRSMAVTLVQGGVSWRGTFYRLRDLREQRLRAQR